MSTTFGLLQGYYMDSADTQQASVDLGTFASCWVYPGFTGSFKFAKRRSRLFLVPCTRQNNRAIAIRASKRGSGSMSPSHWKTIC